VGLAASFAAELNDRIPLTVGSLSFYGESFGRPGDNVHTIVAARSEPESHAYAERLVLTFDQGETLTVSDPQGLEVGTTFAIESASRVTWRWFSYGRDPLPENLYTIDYRLENGSIVVADTSDWYTPQHDEVDIGAPAVRGGERSFGGRDRST
jgi:hypothetical protein